MEADTEETTLEAFDTIELAAADTFDAMTLAAAPAAEMERRAAFPMRGIVVCRWRCGFVNWTSPLRHARELDIGNDGRQRL